MAHSIPKDVAKQIKAKIFAILDEKDYLHQSRKENGQLMDELVSDDEIGGVLGEYIPKSSIKTYIKDAVLNLYSKAAYQKLFSVENVELKISEKEGLGVNRIEGSYANKILFLRAENGTLIVAGIGTVTKWETALRKALEFIEKSPKLPPQNGVMKKYICLSSKDKVITQNEYNHIQRTLSIIGANVIIFQ